MSQEKVYLGDGLNASFDGWQIELRTGNNQVIYLEPSVYGALTQFAAKCWPRQGVDTGEHAAR